MGALEELLDAVVSVVSGQVPRRDAELLASKLEAWKGRADVPDAVDPATQMPVLTRVPPTQGAPS